MGLLGTLIAIHLAFPTSQFAWLETPELNSFTGMGRMELPR